MPYRPSKRTQVLIREHPEVAISIAIDLLRQAKQYVNPVTQKSFNHVGGVLTTIRNLLGFVRGLLLFGELSGIEKHKNELLVAISELKMQLEKYKPQNTKSIEYARWLRCIKELERLARELGVEIHG